MFRVWFIVSIRAFDLPDVPEALGKTYPKLKNYDFEKAVRVRAEAYGKLTSCESALRHRLQNNDPFWQAKAGYTGREEVY